MRESLFKELVDKYFSQVVGKLIEKEDSANPQALMHKTMLTPEYSPDLNWQSTSLSNSVTAADVVSLNSSLPLKQRPAIRGAAGKLPKVGLKFRKSEEDLNNLIVMTARGANEATIASKVFDDALRAIRAIDVRNEIMFQQALSSGQILVSEDNNQGVGIRTDFGYREENTLKAKKEWANNASTPLSDIASVFEKAQADSNRIGHVWIDGKTFNLLRNSTEGKVLGASFSGHVITDKALLPVPPRQAFIEALGNEFGATFHVVDSKFKTEALDGTKKPVSPWTEGNIVFTESDKVGRLVYGTLVEEEYPFAGVSYQKAGDYILISKYSTSVDPVEEYTAGKALCLPVIDGADNIYLLTQK